jgi:16S rRNA (guanine527-N7)-methyltransferase
MIERLAEASGRNVPRETLRLLDRYVQILKDESGKQNLVSASTLGCIWERHILDSAQLVKFAPNRDSSWVDIGSGAGLPGIVIAALVEGPVTLIEPRRLRVEFLERAAAELGLGQKVTVHLGKAESASGRFDVITARAVASADKLLGISTHLSTRNSLWVLPKGRSAQSELAEVRRHWQCKAETVPSRTDSESEILLLRDVRAKGGR